MFLLALAFALASDLQLQLFTKMYEQLLFTRAIKSAKLWQSTWLGLVRQSLLNDSEKYYTKVSDFKLRKYHSPILVP